MEFNIEDTAGYLTHDVFAERQETLQRILVELITLERHKSALTEYRVMKKALNRTLETNEDLLYRDDVPVEILVRLAAYVQILRNASERYAEYKKQQPDNDEIDESRIEKTEELHAFSLQDSEAILACAQKGIYDIIISGMKSHGNYIDYDDLKSQQAVVGRFCDTMNGTHMAGDMSSNEFDSLRRSFRQLRSSLATASDPNITTELTTLVLDDLGHAYDLATGAAEAYIRYKEQNNNASDTSMIRLRIAYQADMSLKAFRPLLNPQIYKKKSSKENVDEFSRIVEETKKIIIKLLTDASAGKKASPSDLKRYLAIILLECELIFEASGIKSGVCGAELNWKPVFTALIEKGRLPEALKYIMERSAYADIIASCSLETLRKYTDPKEVQILRRQHDKYLKNRAAEAAKTARGGISKDIPVMEKRKY